MSRAQTSIPPIPYRYLLNEPYTKFQRDILDPCWMQPGEGWKPCEMKFKGGGANVLCLHHVPQRWIPPL